MEPEVTLVEIDVGSEQYFLQTKIIDDGKGFHLILSNGINVWEGSVSENMLDQFCNERQMKFEDYVSRTKEAFAKDEMSDYTFKYYLSSKTSSTVKFEWKFIKDEIKFSLGSVCLNKLEEPGPDICKMLRFSISNIKSLVQKMEILQEKNDRLSSERNTALKRLEKCVLAKEEMELDLYSKFAAVLNSKKERILCLEERGNNDDNSQIASTSKAQDDVLKPCNLKRLNSSSDDTDQDSEAPQTKKPSHIAKQDTSLNLGDHSADDEIIISSVSAAHRPKRQARKQKTEAKTVLPRLTSGASNDKSITPGRRASNSSRKNSLNKSASNRSSDNLDPDDLLNNL